MWLEFYCQTKLCFFLKWKFPLWGCLVESSHLERTSFRSSLANTKPSAHLILALRLCGRKCPTQQVCSDAVKITRKSRNLPSAWKLAERVLVARCHQTQRDPEGASPGCSFEVIDSRKTEAGLRLGNDTPELTITAWTTAPNRAPGIPVSLALGDRVQSKLGRRVTGLPRQSILCLPDLCNLPELKKQHCHVATATAGTCQHLSP